MFNKPGVFNRNEPITRRDTRSVLGSVSQTNTANTAETAAKNAAPTTPAPQSSATPDAPAPAAADAARETGEQPVGAHLIVGPDVKLKGAEILDCDTLVVEGRVEATMDSRVIRIAEKGAFCGKVSIDVAEIHGVFEGELTARSQLVIHATGKVSGKVRYGKLVIEEGGELSGEIRSLAAGEDPAPSRPRIEPVVTLTAAG